MKYNRQKKIYRDPEERLKDWDEVYDFGAVRSNIREQAARYFHLFNIDNCTTFYKVELILQMYGLWCAFLSRTYRLSTRQHYPEMERLRLQEELATSA